MTSRRHISVFLGAFRFSLGIVVTGVVTLLSVAALAEAQLTPFPPQPENLPWPTKIWSEGTPGTAVDATRLAAALDFTFTNPALDGTRGFLVVHRGRIVAERYAEGFGPDKKFISHSVAKFLLGTIAGLMTRDNLLDVNAPANVSQWQIITGDPRAAITLNNLLQMSSGLEWNENYVDLLSDLPRAMAGVCGATSREPPL